MTPIDRAAAPRLRASAWRRALLPLAALAALLTVLVAPELTADDLGGSDVLRCVAGEGWSCSPAAGCERVGPGSPGFPAQLEIDLRAREVRATEASGASRRSPIVQADRAGRRITLQVVEQGGAWSVAVDESNGTLVASAARDGQVVATFGTCAPRGAARRRGGKAFAAEAP